MVTVIIVGAGPIGLYLAGQLQRTGISYILLEASDKVGGQLSSLYPEKEISDIPGRGTILAKDYIASLKKDVDLDKIKINFEVTDIKNAADRVQVLSKDETISGKFVIIATGLGFYRPRMMGLEREG